MVNTPIYAAQSVLDAEIVIALLRNHGMHPSDIAWSQHVSLAGGNLYYYVSIPAIEVASAIAILKSKNLEQGLMQGRVENNRD